MATIWKWELLLTDSQTILVPIATAFLAVGEQAGRLSLWGMCSPEAHRVTVRIEIRGTGHPMRGNEGRHIGTVVMDDGFVWHVFEGSREVK